MLYLVERHYLESKSFIIFAAYNIGNLFNDFNLRSMYNCFLQLTFQ